MTPLMRVCFVAVCCLAVVRAPSSAAESASDEQILKSAGLDTDSRALLDFFRKQTVTDATHQHARALIQQLGDDSFQVREKASSALTVLGPVILPLLRQVVRETPDFEVRRRARACIEKIQTNCSPTVVAAAARLLALRKPTGTAETLLLFLPSPYEDSVHEEIQAALIAVARIEDRLDPIFVASLTAAPSARRTAAAVTLCRIGDVEHRLAVRKLLQDKEWSVRLAVAQELAAAGDKEAVPVLIELLAQAPAEHAGAVEELLYRLAGVKAPPVPLGGEPDTQRQCRDAWRNWWRAYADSVEMAVLKDRERMLGYTLLVLLSDNRVVEWDRDGKPRWQINGLASPLDAEVLPGQRVLVAEYDTKRATERNFKGEVMWEKKLPEAPIHAHRLSNGFTFIATRKQLLEVDRSGKREILRYHSKNGLITARHSTMAGSVVSRTARISSWPPRARSGGVSPSTPAYVPPTR